MSIWLVMFLLGVAFYLLGSFPTALLLTKLIKKTDLRQVGSSNVGASNAARLLGLRYGILTTIFDLLKGMLAILIPVYFSQLSLISSNPQVDLIKEYRLFFGFCAVLGHMYSIFANFRGGKAVNTTVGIVCALSPLLGIVSMMFFWGIFLLFRYSSLASLLTLLFINVHLWLLSDNVSSLLNFEWWCPPIKIPDFLGVLLITLFVIWKHKQNIYNLYRRTEYQFTF